MARTIITLLFRGICRLYIQPQISHIPLSPPFHPVFGLTTSYLFVPTPSYYSSLVSFDPPLLTSSPTGPASVIMDNIARYNVARKYEKRALLILINCVAGLSIFFFGYDQGVMGGVNGNRNYASTMGFGAYDETTKLVAVKKPLLQGGIVSKRRHITPSLGAHPLSDVCDPRSQSTIYRAHSSVPSSADGLAIDMAVSRPSRSPPSGPSSAPLSNVLPKMPSGCSALVS